MHNKSLKRTKKVRYCALLNISASKQLIKSMVVLFAA